MDFLIIIYIYVPGGNRRPLFLTEQTAQQGNQGNADQRNAAASHELLHALTLTAG